MKAAVKRDIIGRCKGSPTSIDYTGMAEAVLVADEVHFAKLYSEADPNNIADFSAKIEAQVHKLIDATKDKANN